MTNYQQLIQLINRELQQKPFTGTPAELYEPVNYIMALGGKRLRPVLVLMAHEMFGGRAEEALPAALAVEVFHNFTLVHDDIMDQAPLRRNQPTVHTRWNTNTAILSGDLMLVKAYELLNSHPHPRLHEVLQLFSRTAAEVCEGQQLDMNFETTDQVSINDYIRMITLKTAVLLGCALKMGALLGGASEEDASNLYEYGRHVGIGFQLMDDILDVFGEKDAVGKQVGGDIVANKKTYLLIRCHEKATGADREELLGWIGNGRAGAEEKVKAVTRLYEKLGVKEEAEAAMVSYFRQAEAHMDRVNLPAEKKAPMLELARQLQVRSK